MADEKPTLRDQFAMAALTGMLPNQPHHGTSAGNKAELIAALAYELADEMLKERQRGHGKLPYRSEP